MGQKPSTSRHAQREERREAEFRIQMTVQRVENFLLLSYMIGIKIDSLRLILDCEQARLRFHDFLIMDKRSSDLDFWYACRNIESIDDSDCLQIANILILNYLKPGSRNFVSLSYNVRERIFELVEKKNKGEPISVLEIKEEFVNAEKEVLFTLASTSWLKFLQSKSYINWRCQERGHACALTIHDVKDAQALSEPYGDSPLSPARNVMSASTITKTTMTSLAEGENQLYEYNMPESLDMSASAFASIAPTEVQALLANGSQWLMMLIAGAEGIPMCFSVHGCESVTDGNVGFPYIFCNKYFEKTFNTVRSELLGKPFDIVHRPSTAPIPELLDGSIYDSADASARFETNIDDVMDKLRAGRTAIFGRIISPEYAPVARVASTDASGDPNYNPTEPEDSCTGLIVGLQPIFSSDEKTIKYYIGLQHQLHSIENWTRGVKLIEDMFALIPENFDLREIEGSYSHATATMKPYVRKGRSAFSCVNNSGVVAPSSI